MDLAELHLESHFAPRSAGGGMRGQATRVRPVNARARCGTPLSALPRAACGFKRFGWFALSNYYNRRSRSTPLRALFRVRRLRAPLLMLAPRAGSHQRPGGPIEYVTMLVPRAQHDAPLQPYTLPMPMKLPMPLPLPMQPVVPRPPLQSCINLQSRVTHPHHPQACLASHVYPTPVANAPQANDQKDGARARARRTDFDPRGGAPLSPTKQ